MSVPISQIPGAVPVVPIEGVATRNDDTLAELLASKSPALQRLGAHIQRDLTDGRRLLDLRALEHEVMTGHSGRHRRATDRALS